MKNFVFIVDEAYVTFSVSTFLQIVEYLDIGKKIIAIALLTLALGCDRLGSSRVPDSLPVDTHVIGSGQSC